MDAGDVNPGPPACTGQLHQPNHIDLNKKQLTRKQPFNSSNVDKKRVWNHVFFFISKNRKKEKNILDNNI